MSRQHDLARRAVVRLQESTAGERITSKDQLKPGDHVKWRGRLSSTGTGPVVHHHAEVTKVEKHPRFGGHVIHLHVHHINGKPAHEHLDGDKVYKTKTHEQRHSVTHHEIHDSHLQDTEFHRA